MTRQELLDAVANADLDREVEQLKNEYPPDTECVLMGPMGQTEVMRLDRILEHASDRYDLWDYTSLHVCALADYVKTAEELAKETL